MYKICIIVAKTRVHSFPVSGRNLGDQNDGVPCSKDNP